MRILVLTVLAAAAGAAHAQGERRPSPLDPQPKVPPLEFRSAFEGYWPFTDQEMRDWRKANEEVGTAGGHAGHRPGQGPGEQTSKPPPGKPEGSGGPAAKRKGAPSHDGHGAHK